MELPDELAFDRPELEERYRRAVPGYMRRIRELYEAVVERFGEEGLELIREVSHDYGTRIAENVKRHRGEQKGIAAVGKFVLEVFDMVSDDWSVTEFNDERLVISVARCPYPFDDTRLCKAHTCMEQALVSTLDPNLEHSVGLCIPSGDPRCEHIISVRRPAQP